jgi:hypothetical protein
MRASLKKAIGRWYQGQYVPRTTDPNAQIVVVKEYYERHWTARVARMAADFYMREWKWTLGVIGAAIVLIFFRKPM